MTGIEKATLLVFVISITGLVLVWLIIAIRAAYEDEYLGGLRWLVIFGLVGIMGSILLFIGSIFLVKILEGL